MMFQTNEMPLTQWEPVTQKHSVTWQKNWQLSDTTATTPGATFFTNVSTYMLLIVFFYQLDEQILNFNTFTY